jgi:hypothetical protein
MGLTVAPCDPAALAAGILTVLGDREKYVRPRASIEALFHPEKCVAEYERLLTRLDARTPASEALSS